MRLLNPQLPKSIGYYEAMYIRKGRARQMLLQDTLTDQAEHARRLANAIVIDAPTDNSPPNPPE